MQSAPPHPMCSPLPLLSPAIPSSPSSVQKIPTSGPFNRHCRLWVFRFTSSCLSLVRSRSSCRETYGISRAGHCEVSVKVQKENQSHLGDAVASLVLGFVLVEVGYSGLLAGIVE